MKLVSTGGVLLVSALIVLPLDASAAYYLVYGPPVMCHTCHVKRSCYRPVHKIVHHKKYCRTYHRRSSYHITVYYPVPVYPCGSCYTCGSCGGFMEPDYYWAPAPYAVYYASPDDRLVGNRYNNDDYGYDLDTGTADNDID